MDIKEKVLKYREYPDAVGAELRKKITWGYTDEETLMFHYIEKPRFYPIAIFTSILLLALITLGASLLWGIYSLAVLGLAIFISLCVMGFILADDYEDRGIVFGVYFMALMFWGMFGFFGAAFTHDTTVWAWVSLAFGAGAIIVNIIVAKVRDMDTPDTLRWSFPLYTLAELIAVKPIAKVMIAGELKAADKKTAEYEKGFREVAEELSTLFKKSAFTLNAAEYFETDIAKWLRSFKPTTDEKITETAIECELLVDLEAISIGKKSFDFIKANITPPGAGVEAMGIAMAVADALISDAHDVAKSVASKARFTLGATYTTRLDGNRSVAAATITFTVTNTSYEAPRSIYDMLDTEGTGKR